MNSITRQELIEMLKHLDGAVIGSLITETEKKVNGIDCVKSNHLNVVLNGSFQNAVNKSLEKQGSTPNFESGPRKWGTRIPHTPLVQYQDKMYIEARVLKSIGHVLRDLKTGKILNLKDKPSEERVVLRDFKLESVKELRVYGKKFAIK